MEIRLATNEDVPTMVELGTVMFKESSNYGRYSYDPEKVFGMCLYCVDKGIAIVAEEDGKVVGGFLGLVDEHWFGNAKFACDIILFLHPDHRGGRTAMRVIKAAFERAQELGADSFMISNSTGYQGERVEKLYQFMQMERLGGVYVKHFGE